MCVRARIFWNICVYLHTHTHTNTHTHTYIYLCIYIYIYIYKHNFQSIHIYVYLWEQKNIHTNTTAQPKSYPYLMVLFLLYLHQIFHTTNWKQQTAGCFLNSFIGVSLEFGRQHLYVDCRSIYISQLQQILVLRMQFTRLFDNFPTIFWLFHYGFLCNDWKKIILLYLGKLSNFLKYIFWSNVQILYHFSLLSLLVYLLLNTWNMVKLMCLYFISF